MFHIDILQTNALPDTFYDEAPQTKKKVMHWKPVI